MAQVLLYCVTTLVLYAALIILWVVTRALPTLGSMRNLLGAWVGDSPYMPER